MQRIKIWLVTGSEIFFLFLLYRYEFFFFFNGHFLCLEWDVNMRCVHDQLSLEDLVAIKMARLIMIFAQAEIYLELVYLVTALVPSDTACLANSPGRRRRTAVWISLEVMVLLLL